MQRAGLIRIVASSYRENRNIEFLVFDLTRFQGVPVQILSWVRHPLLKDCGGIAYYPIDFVEGTARLEPLTIFAPPEILVRHDLLLRRMIHRVREPLHRP